MRFVSPNRSIIGSAVSGTVQTTYQADWLTDGLPGYPVRGAGGSPASLGPLTITPSPAVSCDVFAVCHHSIDQGASINLTGDVTDTIPTAAWRTDGIPANWFRKLTAPVSVDNLILNVSNNGGAIIIGELYAGLSYQFDVDYRIGRGFNPGEPFPWEGEFSSLAPYDPGLAKPRRLRGQMILEAADYAELEAWDLSTKSGTLPSLIIPNDAVNDAWLCQFRYEEEFDTVFHYITLEIVEIPRTRW